MAATVAQLLDQLANGSVTVQQVADEFARRRWTPPKAASDAEFWGVADDDAPGDNSWETVNADSRLTPEQYTQLSLAYRRAIGSKK